MGLGGKRKVAAVVAVLSSLAWTGCGDADERTLPGRATEGAQPAATPAPDGGGEMGFVAAANAACERTDERMRGMEGPRSNDAWLGFGRRIERGFVQLTDELAALDPPRKLSGAFRTWLRRLEGSRRAFRSLYRTFAFHYPAVEGPNDRVSRALDRVYARDTKARQWVQLRLTDLYSCYNVTAYGYARSAT